MQKDWHPGCTAVASLIVRNKLFVANAGDCRTILCRAGDPVVLSKVSWNFVKLTVRPFVFSPHFP